MLLKLTRIYLASVPSFVPCDLGGTVKTNCTITGSQKARALDFHETNEL
jgi:hypothetical protein